MKKRLISIFTKTISLFLCLSIGLSMFGCNNDDIANDEKSIEINYWNSGLGLDWLNNLKDKFEKQYPEYKVYIVPTSNQSQFSSDIKGTDTTTTDIFMTAAVFDNEYKPYLESLDDILSQKYGTETVTIGEKMNETVKRTLIQDGKTYAMSYGGGVLSLA